MPDSAGPSAPRHVVVVGAGLAGLNVAVALRQHGFDGALTLIGTEPHAPYDRPPLSKDLLLGRADDTTLEADLPGLGVDVRPSTTATGITDRTLHTDRGDLPFDALVVATGSAPIALPGTRTLRTVDDARALRASLEAHESLAIIGAGWIGAEVASAAATLGAPVTVVEALPAPLAAALPVDLGARTIPWYEQAGVRLRLGERVPDVASLAADARAAIVLSAVGVRPATGWLAGSGVALDPHTGAVLVDDRLRTTNPAVFAVGDCAAWPSARFGRRMLVEHWDLALRSPAVVAENLLGGDVVHDPVPYVWSDQFGHHLQYAGHHDESHRRVERGPAGADDAGWAAFWLDHDQRPAAVLTVDRPRDLMQARRLIERGTPLDPAKLADPSLAVKECVR